MKQRGFIVLTSLLLLFVIFGHAENTTRYVHGTTPEKYERIRVALREQPSASSNIVCRIYNDTPVEYIAEAGNGFVKVRMHKVEGYMMQKYLTTEPLENSYPVNGYVHPYNYRGKVQMFSMPEMGEVIDELSSTLEDMDGVKVLAVAEDWVYVEHNDLFGYVPYWYIEEAGSFRTATAWPEKENHFMALYNTPNGDVIGSYYRGSSVHFLFDPELTSEWKRVRIGNTAGYIKNNYTEGWVDDMPRLPEKIIKVEQGCLYAEPSLDSSVDIKIPKDSKIKIMGYIDDWYHVEYGEYNTEIYHGYMLTSDLEN